MHPQKKLSFFQQKNNELNQTTLQGVRGKPVQRVLSKTCVSFLSAVPLIRMRMQRREHQTYQNNYFIFYI